MSNNQRRSKRKLDQIISSDYNPHHINKKFKGLCSGLLEYESETIKNLSKYHYLFQDINYDELSLGSLYLKTNDIYYFCGGDGIKLVDSYKCELCLNGYEKIKEYYNLFDKKIVKEICKFIDISKKKQWAPFIISGNINPIMFTVHIDKEYTNKRSIKWIISEDEVRRIDDTLNDYWASNEGTDINYNYLQELFRKWFSRKVKYCQGIVGMDWFTESNFGWNYPSAKWLNDVNIIIHRECAIKGNKKICTKCKGLRSNINRMKNKNTWNDTPSKHTGTKYLNSHQKELKIEQLKIEKKETDIKLIRSINETDRLKKKYSIYIIEDDKKRNEEYANMIEFVLINYKEIKCGLMETGDDDVKIQFIHDQFKYAKRKYVDYVNKTGNNMRKGMRWSVATINFAADILTKGSGVYKTAINGKAMQLPSAPKVKDKLLTFRHTNMSSMDMMEELASEFILHFGSIKKAQENIWDLALDEIILSDDINMNMSNYTIDGRAAYHNSDNLLTNARHKLFTAKNDKIDDFDGSKYMMQFILRCSTSSFVYYGPYFGSDSGLSAVEILCYMEDDFLLPLKVNYDIEVRSIHGDLNTHHQQYILYKSNKNTLKELLSGPIYLIYSFYDNPSVLFVPDKEHSIKAIRNAISNCILWTPLWHAFKFDCNSSDPVLECNQQTFCLDRFSKMNMKHIYQLFNTKTILALREIESIHHIEKLKLVTDFIELIYDFYIGHYLNMNVGYNYIKIESLDSPWFEETKTSFDALQEFIDKNFSGLADITKVSMHGLYYGMKALAEDILSSDKGFYFCPFKFGEAIVELLFSKLRTANKASAKNYATGIAHQNAALHRKRERKQKCAQRHEI